MSGGGMFGGSSVDDGLFHGPMTSGGDPAAPSIDSSGTPLRQSLKVAFPSQGHMRVCRILRDIRTGREEMQEEWRMPTPEEVEFLREQGVVNVGPGSTLSGVGDVAPAGAGKGIAPGVLAPIGPGGPMNPGVGPGTINGGGSSMLGKVVKIGAVLAVGAAGFWAVNKWVVPKLFGDGDDRDGGDDGGGDE